MQALQHIFELEKQQQDNHRRKQPAPLHGARCTGMHAFRAEAWMKQIGKKEPKNRKGRESRGQGVTCNQT